MDAITDLARRHGSGVYVGAGLLALLLVYVVFAWWSERGKRR